MNRHTPLDEHEELDSLLRVVADPAKHKARLDELIAQENAAKEQIAALNEMASDTRRLHSAAEAATIVADNRRAALDQREAELNLKAQEFSTAEAMRSDAGLRRREAAVQAREEAAKREADRLADLRTEFESKLAKLSHLAAALSGSR